MHNGTEEGMESEYESGEYSEKGEEDPDPNPYGLLETTCPDGLMCYGDTACYQRRNYTYQCLCWHRSVPPRENWECDRNVVTSLTQTSGNNSTDFQQTQHKPIPIMIVHPDSVVFITNNMKVTRTSNTTELIRTKPTSNSTLGYFGTENQFVIPLVSLIIFLLVLLFLLLCFFKRKSLTKAFNRHCLNGKVDESNHPRSQTDSFLQDLPYDRFIINPTYLTANPASVPLLSTVTIYKQDEISSMVQIGEGCFGKVFKGEMNGDLVAVKVTKKEHYEDAFREMETMITFHHPNILELLGVARNKESDVPWLIFELMEFGDLISVLRKSNDNDNGHMSNRQVKIPEFEVLSANPPNITQKSLLDMAYQISEGMKYLASQHFVHRDLAARNCLIGKCIDGSYQVKISDFGLARDVYTCDYYKVGVSHPRLLPVRWMAPESVLYGRFTLESDVWAFGILLWEMYSWGVQPYYGHSNEEVVRLIVDGVLLCPPNNCPPVICDMMAGSWKTNPKDRLTFPEICATFVRTINRMTCVVTTMERPAATDSNDEIPNLNPPVEYI